MCTGAREQVVGWSQPEWQVSVLGVHSRQPLCPATPTTPTSPHSHRQGVPGQSQESVSTTSASRWAGPSGPSGPLGPLGPLDGWNKAMCNSGPQHIFEEGHGVPGFQTICPPLHAPFFPCQVQTKMCQRSSIPHVSLCIGDEAQTPVLSNGQQVLLLFHGPGSLHGHCTVGQHIAADVSSPTQLPVAKIDVCVTPGSRHAFQPNDSTGTTNPICHAMARKRKLED